MFFKPLFITLFLSCLGIVWIPAVAQETNPQKHFLSSEFIPNDAIVAVFYPVADVLKDPEMEMMPIEIFQAQLIENIGVDLLDISSLQVVAGLPGSRGPQAGVVIKLSKDYQISDLNPKIFRSLDPEEQNGITVYAINGPPGTELHRKDARTFFVATGGYLPAMLSAKPDSGPLSMFVAKTESRKGITAIVAVELIRPIVTGMLKQNAQRLPPPLRELAEFAEYTDTLLIHLDYGLMSGSLSVSAISGDEASAKKLERIVNQSIDFGRDMAVQEMKKNVRGDSATERATIAYIDRISAKLSEMARPARDGNEMVLEIRGNIGTTGVLVGLLLPAVQAAREAARRMTASNELKQIGLALHNHHAAYNALPDRAIRDAQGEPLLSWRVKILPFIEQQALYERFHLDEPWDSPHNSQLIPLMPKTYVDPSVPGEPGYTVFQMPIGEKVMFPDKGQRKFRDVLDGLSNTIMVVEASRNEMVPWTKPDDLQLDLSNPLPQLGNTHQGGFHVLLGDGAVKFVASSIDLELLRALFTYQGKEVVRF